MTATFGTQALGAQNLTIMTYFYWFNRGYRNLVMPHQLEAFKIGGPDVGLRMLDDGLRGSGRL